MVDIVAGNGVKGFIWKFQVCGISLHEADILHAFRAGIFFTERFVEGCVFLAPAVDPGYLCSGISLGDRDPQCSAAAAYIQAAAAFRQIHIFRDPLYDLF